MSTNIRLGLRTCIYPVPDLAAAKAWYARAFGVEPYFDEPFYVGFEIGGYELGLIPAQEALAARQHGRARLLGRRGRTRGVGPVPRAGRHPCRAGP